MSTLEREKGFLVEEWGIETKCELRLHGNGLLLWKLPPHNSAHWASTVMATPPGLAKLRAGLVLPGPAQVLVEALEKLSARGRRDLRLDGREVMAAADAALAAYRTVPVGPPAKVRPAREVIHEAMRLASQQGACNLPSCPFEGGFESVLCEALVDAIERDRPTPGGKTP